MYIEPEYAGHPNLVQPPTVPQPGPTPMPTVIPNLPIVHYEHLHETGRRTLWFVLLRDAYIHQHG
jgi:hypothetical protein